MAITRVDCNICPGSQDQGLHASYVAFNPRRAAGSMVVGWAGAGRSGLGGQVACKLALEQFTEGVLEYFDERDEVRALAVGDDIPSDGGSIAVLETSFGRANRTVYEFGHKLAAGGRMSAWMLGFVVEGSTVSAAKVGPGNVFLHRAGAIFPFFVENESDELAAARAPTNCIGTNSLVSVELASVDIEANDKLVLVGAELEPSQQENLRQLLCETPSTDENAAQFLSRRLFDPADMQRPTLVSCVVGPETIYLDETVS